MISQKKDVIFVVTYDNRESIKKVVFQNGIVLDLLPDVQEILYSHRQNTGTSAEAGGLLIGYENVETGNFTVSGATEPQLSDIRTRISLFLGIQHNKLLQYLEIPYGYIGTWHTHPSEVPVPSSTDLKDWKKSIKHNRKSTNALIFIIVGKKGFRVWLCDSNSETFYEGEVL